MCRGLENILDLTIRKVFCKRVPKARDKLPRYGRTAILFLDSQRDSSMQKRFIQKSFNAIANQFDAKRILF